MWKLPKSNVYRDQTSLILKLAIELSLELLDALFDVLGDIEVGVLQVKSGSGRLLFGVQLAPFGLGLLNELGLVVEVGLGLLDLGLAGELRVVYKSVDNAAGEECPSSDLGVSFCWLFCW